MPPLSTPRSSLRVFLEVLGIHRLHLDEIKHCLASAEERISH